MPESESKAPHVIALDGVRGLALLAVLAFHFVAHGPGAAAYPEWLNRTASAGWMGVDLFFVLSGFLITRILLAARGSDHALRIFYARRALRIFPLYYALLLLVTIGLLALKVHDGGDLAAIYLYLCNFNIAAHGWGVAIFHSIQLVHLWTLAIEEQFYLLWPFVVLLLPRRMIYVCCGIIIFAAFASRMMLLNHHADPTAIYVLTWCRADTLAWGGLIALLASDLSPRRLLKISTSLLVFGTIATVIVVTAAASVSEYHPSIQASGYSFIAFAFAGFIGAASVTDAPRWFRAALSGKWLRRIGRYSYGAYLFHIPLRGLASAVWRSGLHHDPDTLSLGMAALTGAVLTVTTLTLAALSFKHFEVIFLRLKPSHAQAHSAAIETSRQPAPARQ